jgi:hypothetical protein
MPALNCKLCVVTLPPGTAKNELLTISPWPLNIGRLMKKGADWRSAIVSPTSSRTTIRFEGYNSATPPTSKENPVSAMVKEEQKDGKIGAQTWFGGQMG